MPENNDPQFYKTVFKLIVLSEMPLAKTSLTGLDELVKDGPCVLHSFTSESREVKPRTMAGLLYEAGSEPGFFHLTPAGKRTED